MAPYSTITFMTDYGLVDESVGVVKSVIRSIAPAIDVVDLTHGIPVFDIRTGGVVLARSAPYMVPGVVLAVVDPGVGTSRKAIAVEVGDGESVLVGPDNGLLAPVVAVAGGATRVVELTNDKFHIDAVGNNFAGRDVFGPVAAHLCNGVDLTEFGPLIDAHALVPATIPFSEEKDGALHADVIYVDHFGNLHLNVDADQLGSYGDPLRLTIDGSDHRAGRAEAYGDGGVGDAVVVVDEAGMMSLAVNQASAAQYFRAEIGTPIIIRPTRSIPLA